MAREDAGSKLQGNHGAVMRPEFAARPGKLLRVKNQLGIKPAPHRRLRLCAGDDPETDPVTEFFNTDRRARKDELSLVD